MIIDHTILRREVYHNDKRHIGRVIKVDSGFAIVQWHETGWLSRLFVGSLTFL